VFSLCKNQIIDLNPQEFLSAWISFEIVAAVAFVKLLFYNRSECFVTGSLRAPAEQSFREANWADNETLKRDRDCISATRSTTLIPAFWLDRRAAVRVAQCDPAPIIWNHCRANNEPTGDSALRASAGADPSVAVTSLGPNTKTSRRVFRTMTALKNLGAVR
jgi:hypothetical protein